MNWIHNTTYEWVQKITATQLMNWNQNTDISATRVISAIFHPDNGYWLAPSSITAVYRSLDGHTWTGTGALPTQPSDCCIAIDGSYYIVGLIGGDVEYTTNGSSWTTISSATIGGSGAIQQIHTKYPDSDYAVLSRGNAGTITVRIASSGITGSWAAATTQPPSVPTNAVARNIIYCGATTWLLLAADIGTGDRTKLYKSTDDADTWVAVPGLSFSASAYGASAMAYSRETARLVVCGSAATSGNEEYIAYSDDLGDTWTAATINKNGVAASESVQNIYYCGGDSWIATSREFYLSSSQTIFVSTDNAETWQVADVNTASVSAGPVIYAYPPIVCDGRQLIVFNDNGFNIASLAG
jgi:hypothetical protein